MKKFIVLSLIVLMNLGVMGIVIAAPKQATVFHPDTGHRKAVTVGDPHAFDGGYLLEVARAVTNAGLIGYSVVTNYDKRLSSSVSATQSTIPVTSMTTTDGHVLVMASDLGSKVFLVIEPGGAKMENIMCTGISGTSWTGCTRGLAFYGTSTAAVTANQKTHNSGSRIIISNTHFVYDELVDKDTTETIEGVKTFTSLPKISTYSAPTADEQFSPKKYVDDVIAAGAPDITETVKGIGELATNAEAAAGTSAGGTGARLVLPASIATSTGGYATSSVPVTGSNGKLAESFTDFTLAKTFSGNNTHSGTNNFTGTTTLATTTATKISLTATSTGFYDVQGKGYIDNEDMNVFYNPLEGFCGTQCTFVQGNYYPYAYITNNQDGTLGFAIKVPQNATSISSIQLPFIRDNTGNVYLSFATSMFTIASGTSITTDSTDTVTTYPGGASNGTVGTIIVPAGAYNGLTVTGGGILGVYIHRNGASATDTYEASFSILGIKVNFQ